jgi:two-component system LytT family sensor kinase
MNHPIITNDVYLIGSLIGYATGLVISFLLLVLTIRVRSLPGTPIANILVAFAAVAWNGGGFAHTLTAAHGSSFTGHLALTALAIQFSSAALWPLPILATWRPFAVRRCHRIGFRVLQGTALLAAAVTVPSLWSLALFDVALAPFGTAKMSTVFSGLALVAGAALFLREPQTSRIVRFSALTIFLGVLVSAATVVVRLAISIPLGGTPDAALRVSGQQAPLLVVLGSFLLFARFRSADLFIRHSVRAVLVAVASVAGVLVLQSASIRVLAAGATFPLAMSVFVGSVVIALVMLSFVQLDRRVVEIVDRWIVRPPDYRSVTRQLGDTLRDLHDEARIIAAAETAGRMTLQLEAVEAVPLETLPRSLWPPDIQDGEIVELSEQHPVRMLLAKRKAELLVPVRTGGRITHLLVVTPGETRRGLVTHEVNYLRTVATQLGGRLDILQLERDMRDRAQKETLLRQQLAEAELRALRAQINPHFLFNSLNTIADLIVANPAGAEAMTLRLAKVFRYVLAHSAAPLTTLHQEVDFVRAYLQIEQVRFEGRLHVAIDVHPEIAAEPVPSLLLQPLVENALKHGLAPRPGEGHLWISASNDGDDVCLRVEDDGVGPDADMPPAGYRVSTGAESPAPVADGVGLTNIARRLSVLYGARASLRLQPRGTGGTSVIVRIPRAAAITSVA